MCVSRSRFETDAKIGREEGKEGRWRGGEGRTASSKALMTPNADATAPGAKHRSPGNSPRNPSRVEAIGVNQPTCACYLMWIDKGSESFHFTLGGISQPRNQIRYFQ